MAEEAWIEEAAPLGAIAATPADAAWIAPPEHPQYRVRRRKSRLVWGAILAIFPGLTSIFDAGSGGNPPAFDIIFGMCVVALAGWMLLGKPSEVYNVRTGRPRREEIRALEARRVAEAARRKEAAEQRLIQELARRRALTAELYALSPRQLEFAVARALQNQGYRTQVTPSTGDFGADVLAEKQGIRTVVEVKHHQVPVGPGVIQRAIGAQNYYDAQKALVVSRAGFTSAAMDVAKKANVTLWDGEILAGELSALDLKHLHEDRTRTSISDLD